MRRPLANTGGTLCLQASSQALPVCGRLRAAGVSHDCRGATLPISVHLCNDAREAEHVASACR